MRRLSTTILAFFIAAVFLLYMVTYTVGYNETAIITTFEKAGPNAVVQEPGLHFKWPWPIQNERKFPRQVQITQDNPEQILLDDGSTVIVNMTVAWTIEDPLEFFKAFTSIDNANGEILTRMSNLRSVVTGYELSDLVNSDPELVKLDTLEDEITAQFQAELADPTLGYGIKVERVSMGRLLYNQDTAQKVNELMGATQVALAQIIRSEGSAEAGTIIKQAETISQLITTFAEREAGEIKNIGDAERVAFLSQFDGDEADVKFAIFLLQLDAAERILRNRTTLILSPEDLSMMDVFFNGPGEGEDIARINNRTSQGPSPLMPPVSAPAQEQSRE